MCKQSETSKQTHPMKSTETLPEASIKPTLIARNQKDILDRQSQIVERICSLENGLNDRLESIHQELNNQRKTIADQHQTIANLKQVIGTFHNEFEKIHARFDEFNRKTLEEVGVHKHRAEVAEQDARQEKARADEALKTFRYQLRQRLLPSLSAAMNPDFSVCTIERGKVVLKRLREILDIMREKGIVE